MKTTLLSLSIAAMLGATAVEARPFYMDLGRDYANFGTKADGATTTGLFNEALVGYWSTTYISDTDGDTFVSLGDEVRGTGGLLNEAQFGVGNSNLSENMITNFTPRATSQNPLASSTNGYNFPGSGLPGWELSLGWDDLTGTITSNGIQYNGGTIKLFLFDAENGGATGLEVMNIDVQSGGPSGNGQSLNFNGIVDFTGIDLNQQIGDSSTLGGLFNFDTGSFGDLWGSEVEISAFSDQNSMPFRINGGEEITQEAPDFTGISFGDGVDDQVIISARHDGSMSFEVPEPTSIALLGIGLLGLGGAAWRRKSA